MRVIWENYGLLLKICHSNNGTMNKVLKVGHKVDLEFKKYLLHQLKPMERRKREQILYNC